MGQTRVTLLVVLVFAVLAAAAYVLGGRGPGREAEQALLSLEPREVTRIEVLHQGRRLTLEKRQGYWLPPGAPVPTPAPSPTPSPGGTTITVQSQLPLTARADALVTQVVRMQVERVVVAQPSTSPDYGLDQPAIQITLATARGATAAISIGGKTPNTFSRYVRREGRDVVLVGNWAAEDVEKAVQEIAAQVAGQAGPGP